ncbi:MAG TPA: MerR family transcriptional regulator [Intrasporangium sp.]|uniref:MerR family transcriptional regulator n=1 Tax=Intrasporangium sp. TaxID=1925024 RepID=UPI002B47B086|nr:MerR family transcriptional regulator [Intrasporangium sp.]HKX67232.1 MerR family transcriptional regulator [Intrasporangium sp.]
MRISELSQRTGVSVATLKYYLREGLVPAGVPLSATRADYGESHVERVRLVRSLIDVAGLSIERVREVVQALSDPPTSRHGLLGIAHAVLRSTSPAGTVTDAHARQLSDQVIDGLGWHVGDDSVARAQLGAALDRARGDGLEISEETFAVYAQAALLMAAQDVRDELGLESASEALRYVILGNVLSDPVVIGLRRLAQEHVSAGKFAGDDRDHQ